MVPRPRRRRPRPKLRRREEPVISDEDNGTSDHKSEQCSNCSEGDDDDKDDGEHSEPQSDDQLPSRSRVRRHHARRPNHARRPHHGPGRQHQDLPAHHILRHPAAVAGQLPAQCQFQRQLWSQLQSQPLQNLQYRQFQLVWWRQLLRKPCRKQDGPTRGLLTRLLGFAGGRRSSSNCTQTSRQCR